MWSATLAFNGLTSAGWDDQPAGPYDRTSLSALYDIPHGAGLSIVTPGWMEYAAARDPKKFARLAREVFAIGKADEREAALREFRPESVVFRHRQSDVAQRSPHPEGDNEKITEMLYAAQVWQLKDYTREVISDILRRACKE